MAIPKATEDTVTAMLRDELLKLAVKSELIPSITTPNGVRKPDILCTNGGLYPLEAKYFERDLISAIVKIQNDYLKHSSLLNISGGFAILYPDQLSNPMSTDMLERLVDKLDFKLVQMFPDKDPRPFTVNVGKLNEIANLIAINVKSIPPKNRSKC